MVLIRKLAEVINGIDLSERSVGDRVPVGPTAARLLIAEGWARPARRDERRETNGDG